MHDLSSKIMSDIILHMKYAKFIPEKQRRENWNEVVTRNKKMHIDKYPHLIDEIENAYKLVYEKKVLPSMRSLQFGGKPIELNPARGYNCSALHVDHPDAFPEIMFLLLSGAGVGFSCQRHHVEKLPMIKSPIVPANNRERKKRFLISDSIEGWADAIKVLMKSYFEGSREIEFDYRDIRPKGARLVTSGGKAPGPQPLKDCIHNIRKVLDRALAERGNHTKLKPIEVHDIVCFIADAVLSGGIRRSACISLFSFDDDEMLSCKFGDWWETNPQRARANNSVVLVRHKINFEDFMKIWKKVEASGSGEPGVFFTNDKDLLVNPCAEISLKTNQFCNLTTIPIVDIKDQADFNERCRAASFIGTLQAGYTDFHYLRDIWRETTEKDGLIGVSMTGVADKNFLKNIDLEQGALIVNDENKRVAKMIGINPASRTTTLKPEGCLDPKTQIRTTDGILSLEEIFKEQGVNIEDYVDITSGEFIPVKKDMYVLDKDNHEKLITQLYVNGISDTYNIEFEDGTTVSCTPWHRFLTENRGWVRADELTDTDEIVRLRKTGATIIKIKTISKGQRKLMVDIEVKDTHSYQLGNGVVTHNTSSLLVGTSSGVHAWYNDYYIRRIRVGKNEAIYTYLSIFNPSILEDDFLKPQAQAVISLPMKAPEGAILRTESALDTLERVKMIHSKWIRKGHRKGSNFNNVSCTINIKPHEWDAVGNWMWENREHYNAISVLPYDNGTYKQAPFEDCTKDQYEKMLQSIQNINLDDVWESDDNTDLQGEVACSGGQCEIK